ncbi:MAG: hypothetical protein HOD60_08965 [Candidatus Nitrosopelagicus sp.]|jgi:hypothetical protein|nr:hypothetical protein [Candidatus Nitrosopelagicus sp.]
MVKNSTLYKEIDQLKADNERWESSYKLLLETNELLRTKLKAVQDALK